MERRESPPTPTEMLELLKKAQETLPEIPDRPKILIMHPVKAALLLEHFLGIQTAISSVCPEDTIYISHEDFTKVRWDDE